MRLVSVSAKALRLLGIFIKNKCKVYLVDLKWLSLIVFTLTHSVLTIALRVELMYADHANPVISSAVVFVTEVCKLLLSILAVLSFDCQGPLWTERLAQFHRQLARAFVDEAADLLKLCVPAILYTVQNNFQYVIETSTLFVILYQLKNITTAVFYEMMLHRPIRRLEWLTIGALTFGIGLVQASQTDIHLHHASNVLGVFAVTFACLSSGFAGVYFEKTMIHSRSTIWMINLQMSLVSASISMFECLAEETEEIAKYGIFKGFTALTWLIVILQASAGLSIAMVCRWADNIYKGFAYGWSVVLACALDWVFLAGYTLNSDFIWGTVLIAISSKYFVWLHENFLPSFMQKQREQRSEEEHGNVQAALDSIEVGGESISPVPFPAKSAKSQDSLSSQQKILRADEGYLCCFELSRSLGVLRFTDKPCMHMMEFLCELTEADIERHEEAAKLAHADMHDRLRRSADERTGDASALHPLVEEGVPSGSGIQNHRPLVRKSNIEEKYVARHKKPAIRSPEVVSGSSSFHRDSWISSLPGVRSSILAYSRIADYISEESYQRTPE